MYKYIGEFKNNEFDGKGTAYYVGGEINQGIWKNGKFLIPKTDSNTIRSRGNLIKEDEEVSSIIPIPFSNLEKYNVVVGSYFSLSSAQRQCQKIRDDGFFSNIIIDSSKMYRVSMYKGTNSEAEALSDREFARQAYPDAWIFYVINGKEERYN